MILILASVVAGLILSSAESIYILFFNGPFWMTPWVFIETWAIYTIIAFPGIVLLNLLLHAIPPLKWKWMKARGQLTLLTAAAWISGFSAMLYLIVKDLRNDATVTDLIVITAVVGLLTNYLIWRLTRDPISIPAKTIMVSVLVTATVISVYFIQDVRYTGLIKERNVSFNAPIPHACLLVIDTARRDHFSCYGYEKQTTPNIDRIASEGLLCQNAFSVTNWTPPGHISIFTGKNPLQHGNDGKPFMPEKLLSITEIMNQRGFFCVAMYNNPIAGRTINLTQGFDLDIGVWGNTWVYPSWMRVYDKFIVHDSGSKATFPMAEATFNWVERKGGHLFLYINVTEPHAEYVKHEPYFSEFSRDIPVDKIPNMQKIDYLSTTHEVVLYDSVLFQDCSAESYRYIQAIYDSELAYLDYHFGKFADSMSQNGILDRTLLVITADHGEFLGEHWTVGHPPLLLNPVLQIPLMIRYPALIPSETVKEYTSNVDVFPTMLNLLECEETIPEDISGLNLMAALPKERPILSAHINDSRGIYSLQNGRYKLVIDTGDYLPQNFPSDTLLFDEEVDAQELVNLYRIQPELRQVLETRLDDWAESIRVTADDNITVSEETMANLKALGYVH